VTGLLRGLIKNAKFPKDLALVYTSRRVVYREMTFPEMPLAELHDTLPFQVKNYIALPVDDSIIDFVPLTREEQAQGAVLHCMVVATLHTGVERTTTAIQNAGFAVRSVDVGAFSLARIFRDQSRDKATAVVNVGSNSTDVIVLLQGHPVALRAVPSGADDITQAVAKALDILFEGALEIKNRISLQNVIGDERLEKAEEIIRDTTAQLIVGIRNTLNVYNTDPRQWWPTISSWSERAPCSPASRPCSSAPPTRPSPSATPSPTSSSERTPSGRTSTSTDPNMRRSSGLH
jgi:type IV pilus assembly protein PilM